MVSPVGYTYTCASGQGIYGGKYNWPAWRRAIAAQHWGVVPSNTLASIDPEDNPAYNPSYPGSANWHGTLGQQAMVSAWCGGCYDSDGDVLWLIQGGGHQDYGGNEPYKLDLSLDTPQFTMVRAPSTDLSGDGSNGLYGDGRPRSTHTYNGPVYIDGVGPAMPAIGATYPNLLGVTNPYIMSAETGEMITLGSANPFIGRTEATAAGACYDPSRHCIWAVGIGSSGLCRWDIATDTWYYADNKNSSGGYIALEYMPDHDCLFMIGKNYPSGFRIIDCTTLATYTPTATGSLVGMDLLRMSSTAGKYCQDGQFVAIWNNDTDTTKINIFNVPSDPMTGTWSIEQLPVAPTNSVTPTVRTGWGTYGRFFYSKKLDGFGLLNGVDEQPYFYARS